MRQFRSSGHEGGSRLQQIEIPKGQIGLLNAFSQWHTSFVSVWFSLKF